MTSRPIPTASRPRRPRLATAQLNCILFPTYFLDNNRPLGIARCPTLTVLNNNTVNSGRRRVEQRPQPGLRVAVARAPLELFRVEELQY